MSERVYDEKRDIESKNSHFFVISCLRLLMQASRLCPFAMVVVHLLA